MSARRASAALLVAGAIVGVVGCPPPETECDSVNDPTCTTCGIPYVGDVNADIELELIRLDPQYKAHPITEGGDVSILIPPQGGRVIFAGVRAKNLNPCAVNLSGSLRDPSTMQVRVESRTINLDLADDGWAASDATDISTFSNIPICPNQWASTDVFDQAFDLRIRIKDQGGKEAEKTLSVTPRCDEVEAAGVPVQAECLCICQQGYELGMACDPP